MITTHDGRPPGPVAALGYLGLTSTDLEAWARMARVIGLGVEATAGVLGCTLDERAWRLRVEPGAVDDVAFIGWELRSGRDLGMLRTRLEESGHRTAPIGARRGVVEGFATVDPDGNALEFFVGALAPGLIAEHPTASFKTGLLGIGHVVLFCDRFDEMLEYYVGDLGFGISDTYGDAGAVDVAFLHCNERHHSLALARGRREHVMQHFMIEVDDIDQVGRTFDACAAQGLAQSTVGRHTNDHMFSFYVLAPGGYTIEYGADGRLVTDPELQPHFGSTSIWGHHDLVPSR